ncbi:MAG: zf-HC2 domain-containing protein [Oscillospiraceae bacterium]|nr:zf-HC2 domain-containing protein [Oscillospiraceae bacterium]
MPELDNCSICDSMEELSDRYFHGELSPEDKKMLEEHLENCAACKNFFINEKKYFEIIKLAEYTPKTDIAGSVMEKIISEKIVPDIPAKKRFIPFGLISAAVIVLVMFIASRDTLNLFDSNKAINESADNIQPAEAAFGVIMDSNMDMGADTDGAVGEYGEMYEDDAMYGYETEAARLFDIWAEEPMEAEEAEEQPETMDALLSAAAPAPEPAGSGGGEITEEADEEAEAEDENEENEENDSIILSREFIQEFISSVIFDLENGMLNFAVPNAIPENYQLLININENSGTDGGTSVNIVLREINGAEEYSRNVIIDENGFVSAEN